MNGFKKWRLDNGYSRRFIASTVGCHLHTVGNWDSGSAISYEYWKKIKDLLKVDLVEDFGFTIDERVLR